MNELKLFYDWLQEGRPKILEARLPDYKVIQYLGQKYGLQTSHSGGVFFKSYEDLEKIMTVAKSTTIWLKPNPKKKALSPKSDKKILDGYDTNVESIAFVVIDIDRKHKETEVATESELKIIKEFVDKDLRPHMEEAGLIDYAVIYSGNGFHVIIRLDEEIILPECAFDLEQKIYLPDLNFEKYKALIRKTIGHHLISKYHTKEYRKKYNIEIDEKPLMLNGGCAIPLTYNFKSNPPRQRRLIYLAQGKRNYGMASELISNLEKIDVFQRTGKNNQLLDVRYKVSYDNMYQNPIIKALLGGQLPAGNRNNMLIFALKCLLQQSGLDLNDKRIRHLHARIQQVQQTKFPFNPTSAHFAFHPNVVNNYCMINLLPLLYPDDLCKDRRKCSEFPEHVYNFENAMLAYVPDDFKKYQQKQEYDDNIVETMRCIKQAIYDYHDNEPITFIYSIAQSLAKTFGEEQAKVIYEQYVRHIIPYIKSSN
jgi:hypothetical protein